jgi:Zn-dependent M28 family amino/carboxypeptidase
VVTPTPSLLVLYVCHTLDCFEFATNYFHHKGINDDGSGTITVLEIALKLPFFKVKNAVRFGFWTAEEFGLVGSEHYITNLSEEERQKIALYLNFDMVASPNFGYFVYNGDGTHFPNIPPGPPGSDHIEDTFNNWFAKKKLPSAPTEFSGRSDYGPFLDVGIPAGGLFTGAEGIKTEEQAALYVSSPFPFLRNDAYRHL